MLIEEAIYRQLTRTGAQTGPLVGNRIFPDFVPDDAAIPAIVYERRPEAEYDYTCFGELDHQRPTYNFHCYAGQNDKRTALLLANAIRADLHGYNEAIDATLTVHGCYANDQYDAYEGTTKRHRVTITVEILYSEKV